MRIDFSRRRLLPRLAFAFFFALPGTMMAPAQQASTASVVQQVDAAVEARTANVVGYSVAEHYAVYRSNDEVHPVAEMTVMTTYQKDTGKSYTVLSETGSSVVRNFVLDAILENEKALNQPGTREGTWITSANYEMTLKPGGTQRLDGRDCLVLTLTPKRKADYLIEGILWVDSKDGSIVQLQGTASKSSSVLTGPTEVTRQYENISGFAQATHVRAVSKSFMLGETVVKIDYQGYQVQLRPHG
jgi:outer membrane lipoprotein-sorting protein